MPHFWVPQYYTLSSSACRNTICIPAPETVQGGEGKPSSLSVAKRTSNAYTALSNVQDALSNAQDTFSNCPQGTQQGRLPCLYAPLFQ